METKTQIQVGERCALTRTLGIAADPRTVTFTVRVMAVVEGYAMVRRPHAMPFVVAVKELNRLP